MANAPRNHPMPLARPAAAARALRALLPAAAIAGALVAGAPHAHAAQPPVLADAEIFATNNTAVITNDADPRLDTDLQGFARRVTNIVNRGGGVALGSQLLDGVFFSSDLGTTTFETSREFDVDDLDGRELRDIAQSIRQRFHQESVLTFDLLPDGARHIDGVQLEVPGVTATALRNGQLADQNARENLFGGSVTQDGRLILIASLENAD